MAVHRLYPTPAAAAPPTTPAVRRSARLGSPCSRKRARVSDSSPEQPSSSKLQLTPEPTPRSVRAQKRQKILDGSFVTPNVDNGSTRTTKRKTLDEQHHYDSDNHNRVVKKKRKENIVNDALVATPTSLKITMNLDTRMGGGNNRLRNADQSYARNTRSSASKSISLVGLPESKPKSIPKSKSQLKTAKKDLAATEVPLDPPSDPSCSSTSRMVTRTMKKLSAGGAPGEAHIPIPSTTMTHVLAPGSKTGPLTILSALSLSVISSSDTSNIIQPSPTSTTTPDAGVQPSSDTNDVQPSLSPFSSSPSISSVDLLIPLSMPMPLPFMGAPLSMPLNTPFLNMPLNISLSMPLSMLAPSESELGFGFHPQEEFGSTAGQEDGEGNGSKGKGKEREEGAHIFMNGEQSLSHSTSPLLTPTTSSSDISDPSSSLPLRPPQSYTPCLNPTPTVIPARLSISTCPSDPPLSTSLAPTTSPTSSYTYSPYSSYTNPTLPAYSSPLRIACFPTAASISQQLESSSAAAAMDGHQRRMKEWDTMDMAENQRQMDIGLSISAHSYGDSSQRDESCLTELQGQQLEQKQDRSPLLGPILQPQPPPPCSSSSSRQYHKKIEYPNPHMPEWTPKVDRERSLWKLACKIRVWEITKRYTPDTIRTVVAQEAHDYYSVHGFPLGYGLVPLRGRRRRWRRDGRKLGGGCTSPSTPALAAMSTPDLDPASSSSSSIMTPPLSPSEPTHRDDEFMNEETYQFELLDDDDDDDMDGLVGGVAGGLGVGGLRSMEDEWREFEDDGFEFEDYDEDEDDEDEDLYDYEEEEGEVEEVEGDQTKISENGKKKGVSLLTTTTPGEDQDQDPDGEGEMEIDIEPFQDPSFNAELSSPTSTSPTSPASPTCSSASSKSKSKSKSNSVVGNEPQSFVSSFYIPPVPAHVQMQMMQMQMQQRQEEEQQQQQQQQQQQTEQQEDGPVLMPSSLDSSTTPPSPVSSPPSEGPSVSTSETPDHAVATTTTTDNNNCAPIQIHLPPASHHHHHHHQQLIQLSPSILPLPPPRLDSIRAFILRQSEMGGPKTTGRGTPADKRRGAIWGWGGITGGQVGSGTGSKRGLDGGKEIETESEEEQDEGGKRGRPRLRLMLADHDLVSEPRRGRGRGHQGEGGNGVKTTLRLSLPGDTDADERMPTKFKCDIPETHNNEDIHGTAPKPSSTFVATDQTWDAFFLDDKSQPHQQQGEEGALVSSINAADSDTTLPGQLLLHLDTDRHRHHRQHEHLLEIEDPDVTPRLTPPSSSLEGSSGGMFMFDQGGDSSSAWFVGAGADGMNEGSGRSVVGLSGSSGTCPSDALALEGFNFPVGPDGSSTLSYALG